MAPQLMVRSFITKLCSNNKNKTLEKWKGARFSRPFLFRPILKSLKINNFLELAGFKSNLC